MPGPSEYSKRIKVKVTSAEIYNSFIKIKAQSVSSDEYIELLDLKAIFKSVNELGDEELVLSDNIFIARLSFDDYARCRIVEVNDFQQIAAIDLIDMGIKLRIGYNNLRMLPKSSHLSSIPSICKEFIIAELIVSREYEDYKPKFSKFNELVVNKFFDMEILCENAAGTYVHLYSFEASIIHDIVPYHPSLKTFLKRINISIQKSLMLEQFLNDPPHECDNSFEKVPKPMDLTEYNPAEEFPLGINNEVKISAYENGPKEFYVQSTKRLEELQKFHINLQQIALQPLKRHPKELEVYLGYLEANNVQRVQVLEVNGSHVTVRLVDHGTKRMLDVKDLYKMPNDIKCQKPFAWKFSLHQIEELCYMNMFELIFYFQYITNDKRLSLSSMIPSNGINECILYESSQSIFSQLKSFNPKQLRYPRKEPLSSSQKIKIVNAESPKVFFVNVCDSLQAHQYFFAEFAKFNSCTYSNPAPGSACCVKLNDKNCRGRFEKKIASTIYQIKLVDIGIIEDFSYTEVKVMVDKFTKVPPLSYKCCLAEFKDSTVDKSTTKAFLVACKKYQTFNMKVKSVEGDVYYVTMENEAGNNVAEELTPLSVNISLDFNSNFDENENLTAKCDVSLGNSMLNVVDVRASMSLQDWTAEERKELGDKDFWHDSIEIKTEDFNFDGIVTSVISPNDFTLQCADSLPKIEALLKELQNSKNLPLTIFTVNTICKVYNPHIKQWCRGIILESDLNCTPPRIVVRDTENGFTLIFNDPSELKEIPLLSILHQPHGYGIRCKLPIQVNPDCEDEATRIFSEMINKKMKYKILGCNKYYNVCDILCEGKQITEHLARLGLGKKMKTVSNGPAYVVHVKSLKEFYVHLKHETGLLEIIQNYSKTYEQTCMRVPLEGMKVMSFSKEYNGWYRAKIKSIDDKAIKVKYIDYGNCEEQEKCKVGMINDPNISKMPPLAHRCSLYLDKCYDPESPAAVDAFLKLANKGLNELIVRLVEADRSHSVVEIYNQNEKNILDELILLCKKLDEEQSLMNDDTEIRSSESSLNSNE